MRKRTRKPEPIGHDVTAVEWEAARDAWLLGEGIEGVMSAAGIGKELALELVEIGDRRRGRPSLREEARLAAATSDGIERRMRSAIERFDEGEVAALLETRARKAKEAEERTNAVLSDAATSRVEEVQLVRSNRLGAMALAHANARLLRVVGALSSSLLEAYVDGNGHPTKAARDLGTKEKVGLVRTIAQVVQRTAEASAKAVQMERLLMGEPTHILGHANAEPPKEMTPEEAVRWIAMAARLHRRREADLAAIDVDASLEALPPSTEPH